MHTPATIKKHPLHPMLVAFPIGLLTFSLISDLIALARWGGDNWNVVALYTLGAGIISALVAAVPGLIDLLSLQDPGLKKKGIIHAVIMLITVGIFVVGFFVRIQSAEDSKLPVLLSAIGVLFMMIGGWIGAELVHHFGVGVDGSAVNRPTAP
jgi:uncharacterized membrane protein